ncbi:MAG: efflux RND transporter permease subunit, partial [Devosia sp.]
LVSALIFMPIIGAIIASKHVDPKAKEAADIVMYPDKFDVNKVRGITGVYVRVMSKLLHTPLLTLPIGFALVIACFVIYGMNPTGSEAFPASEPEFGTVSVVARGNYSPAEIRDFLVEVENKILTVEGVQDSVMSFGGGSGGFGGGGGVPDTIGTFQLQLLPWNERVPADEIFTNIRNATAAIPGLQIQIAKEENGPPAGKAINLRVESTNYDDLLPVVARLRNFVEHDLGDTIDVEDGRPSPGIDWEVTIDRVAAAKYGIGVRELAPYVQLVTSGVRIGAYRPDDSTDELDIRVRLPKEQRTFDALDSLRIVTPKGLVPVSNFVKRQAVPKVASLSRRNGVYAMSVAANLTPGVMADSKIAQVKKWEAAEMQAGTIPSDTKLVFGGAEEQIGDTNAFIMKALGAALFLIFLILLIEYNSFWQVIVTISTVVMSLAGVFLGMSVTGMSFSAIMTGLGIVALAGIVVKNGIVLTDTYNHYNRDDGVEPIKAMLLTISQRVRPVLLTATVTALGVIPMALNIEFDFIRREIVVGGLAGSWFTHLSAALVSGLFVSTALTLVMVPVMIVAPGVAGHQLARFFRAIGGFFSRLLGSTFGRGRALTPDGTMVDVPSEPPVIVRPPEPVEEIDPKRQAAE